MTARRNEPDSVEGRFVGIEVKDVKGKLNANQERFKEALEAAGGRFITARSLEDVQRAGL